MHARRHGRVAGSAAQQRPGFRIPAQQVVFLGRQVDPAGRAGQVGEEGRLHQGVAGLRRRSAAGQFALGDEGGVVERGVRQQRLDGVGIRKLEHRRGRGVQVAVDLLPRGDEKRDEELVAGDGRSHLQRARQVVRPGQMRAGHDVDFAGVVALGRAVRCHRRMAALRVPGQHHLARQRGAHRGSGIARGANRIDHRAGLGIGMQVRVVGVGRLRIAEVVGGDHRVALSRVHGGEQKSLSVGRVGQGARLLHVGALGVGNQGRSGGAGGVAGRHQHHRRRVRIFAFDAGCPVVQGHDLDIALGRATEGLQTALCGASVDLRGAQRCHGDRGVDQDATRRCRIIGAAAGCEQGGGGSNAAECEDFHDGFRG